MRDIKKILFLAILSLALTSCNTINVSSSTTNSSTSNLTTTTGSSSSTSSSSSSSSTSLPDLSNPPSGNLYGLLDNVQDGVILHAWNWSMNSIKEALPQIAAAGYTTVQTSPMQPQKDYSGQANWSSDWWKLYQPLGFSVATKNHSLGTKQELKALCDEADKYGIKIIVDVVSNHLAGGSAESFNYNVREYEPEIYDNNLLHKGYGYVNDNNVEQLVRGHLGDYPDLQTENEIVQNRVLSLLKKYVDCGVDGFRFDAAKHIETKYDGEYASNYWDFILDGANEYALSLEKNPLYYYGEILNTQGAGRELSWYTELMSVTDSNQSTNILNYTRSDVDPSGLQINDPTKKVLWAESHDTYANDTHITTYVSQNLIDRAYAISTSFKGATALYFSRPTQGAVLGQISTNDWQSNQISHVNKFHNQFYNSNTSLDYNNGYFINVRENSEDYGMLLVSLGNTVNSNVTATFTNLKDGTYIDQVSGNTFTVINNAISGEMDECGIAVLYEPDVKPLPIIDVSNDGSSIIYDPIDVTINVSNATTSYYQIDNNDPVYFQKTTTVRIGENVASGDIALTIIASNGENSIGNRYIYQKRDRNNLMINIVNIDSEYVENRTILAWVWKSGQDGRWVEGNLVGNNFSFSITDNDTHFLLASFDSSIDINSASWDNCIDQTTDIVIDVSKTYDGSTFTWRQPL